MLEFYTDKEILILLGKMAKNNRLAENITQEELADYVGVNRRTIQLFEQGKGISLLYFIRIMKKINLEDDLITLIPDRSEVFDPYKPNNSNQKQRVTKS
jgi:transcriptional regulator with XRE-family HTH domain